MQPLVIGIDFDNTIADWDAAFARAARDWGLLAGEQARGKRQVRAALRRLPKGEELWMRLQGEVYGFRWRTARLMPGVDSFLARCREREGVEVFIVSHKTRRGHFHAREVDLREVARRWLAEQGFFDHLGLEPGRVFFSGTRTGKLERIRELGCHWFIDDLPAVLLHPEFPPACRPLLFTGGHQPPQGYPGLVCRYWRQVEEVIFGNERQRAA